MIAERELLARLRALVKAKDAEVSALRAELEAERGLRRRLELDRQLRMDCTDSGTPSSKERIREKEHCQAERHRQESERERSRAAGGPGIPGRGLARDPESALLEEAGLSAECRWKQAV